MKKHLRVLVLMHEDLVPPEDLDSLDKAAREQIRTELDVVTALRELKHDVRKLGVRDELRPLRLAIQDWKPDVVFNLLEEFHGEAVYDHNVVSYLELMRVPYTGCNPRGLVLARDKALSKKILHYHRIPVPKFAVAHLGRRFRRPKAMGFPLIVKSLIEEASAGISQASVVQNDEKLAERVRFIHEKVKTDAIVESFVDGRELNLCILGNQRLAVLPIWELFMDKMSEGSVRIATRALKWDLEYQAKHQIKIGPASALAEDQMRRLINVGKRIYRVLELSGYARLDFRLDAGGRPYFLEANPNPDIARVEEFASAAKAAGLSYESLLHKMLTIGLQRAAARRS